MHNKMWSKNKMLFNIYMRPGYQYADDTQLYITFSPTTVDAVSSLRRCLEAVLKWMQVNGLRLKSDKMKVLRMGSLDVHGLGNSLFLGG